MFVGSRRTHLQWKYDLPDRDCTKLNIWILVLLCILIADSPYVALADIFGVAVDSVRFFSG